MNNEELTNNDLCPFCGGESELSNRHNYVRCCDESCELHQHWFTVKFWNTRSNQAVKDELIRQIEIIYAGGELNKFTVIEAIEKVLNK